MVYQKNLQNQRYASLRQSHVYPDNFVYGIYLPHHRSVLRNADQFCNAELSADGIDKKRCHRFEVEESLLELLRRMKRLRVRIKNCIFYDRFSFMKPTAKWARSRYYPFLSAKGKARFPKQLLTSWTTGFLTDVTNKWS